MKRTSNRLTSLMPRSKLVRLRWPLTLWASDPRQVRSPVSTTTAVAEPLTTLVPRKQSVSSSRGLVRVHWACGNCACFPTGSDSPLRAAWLTNRSLDCSSRTSAGIMSPAAKRTRSPGTNRSMGISWGPAAAPSSCRPRSAARPGVMSWWASWRSTVAVVWTNRRNPSAARSERYSCEKRRLTLKRIMVPMISAALRSPLNKERAAMAASKATSGLRKVASSCLNQETGCCRAI